jgi:Mg-chelatase subunit ChlD
MDAASLSMLASAVAGLPVTVQLTAEHSGVRNEHQTIVVSSHMRTTDMRQAVIVQAMLIGMNSMQVLGIHRLIGKKRCRERYMQYELSRALQTLGSRLPAHMLPLLQPFVPPTAPANAQASLALALSSYQPLQANRWPQHLGDIRPVATLWHRFTQATTVPAEQPKALGIEQNPSDAEEDRLTSKILALFSNPLAGGPLSQVFMNLLGLGSGKSSRTPTSQGPQVNASTLAGTNDIQTATSANAQQRQARSDDNHHDPTSSTVWATHARHPEWMASEGRYRQAWVTIHEFTPPRTDDSTPMAYRPMIQSRLVQQQLARVAIEFQRHRKQTDGQDFDLDALVSRAMEGGQGHDDGRLYLANRKTRRDLTLLVLLDISHSTGDRNEQGVRIIDQQTSLTLDVLNACAQLGDQVGVYAFHSWGRHLVHFLRIKPFAERFGKAVEQRLQNLTPSGMTRMGAAIRHASALMNHERHHSHCVMLLLSDGFAYDDQYEGHHAQEDTAQALREAQSHDIACVCLNIGSQQDDQVLQQLYGPSAYLRCENVNMAVPALRQLMQAAIYNINRPRRHA